MIEINLLPLELQEKKKISFEGAFNKKITLVVLGSLVLLHLSFISLNTVNKIRIRRLTNTWQGLSAEREKLSGLERQLSEINAKIPLIEQLIKDRILWSRKLNQLSELIVPGVWLNELTLQSQETKDQTKSSKYLVIQGSCASRTKDEPALIGRFMQNLKSDSLFSSDFTEIELGPIKKRLIKQTEIMDFQLTCRFKQQ
ncbi:MAG: PilN domain-containing protein [Candidatus Hodarchaeota archaeon]